MSADNDANSIELEASVCQDRLVMVWLVGLVAVVLILLLQLTLDTFRGKELEAAGWCTQALSPLLASMLAKWAGIGRHEKRVVRKPIYSFAFFMSVVYLAIIVVSLSYVGGGVKVDDNGPKIRNLPSVTSDAEKRALAVKRLDALTKDSLALGLVMVPLGYLIAACFGGKPPTRIANPRPRSSP